MNAQNSSHRRSFPGRGMGLGSQNEKSAAVMRSFVIRLQRLLPEHCVRATATCGGSPGILLFKGKTRRKFGDKLSTSTRLSHHLRFGLVDLLLCSEQSKENEEYFFWKLFCDRGDHRISSFPSLLFCFWLILN